MYDVDFVVDMLFVDDCDWDVVEYFYMYVGGMVVVVVDFVYCVYDWFDVFVGVDDCLVVGMVEVEDLEDVFVVVK